MGLGSSRFAHVMLLKRTLILILVAEDGGMMACERS